MEPYQSLVKKPLRFRRGVRRIEDIPGDNQRIGLVLAHQPD